MNKKTLFFKGIASTSIFSFIFLLVASWVITSLNSDYKESFISNRLKNESSTIGILIRDNYLIGDLVSLRSYLDNFARTNQWTTGSLIDAEGTLIWSYSAPLLNSKDVVAQKVSINGSLDEPVAHLTFEKDITESTKLISTISQRFFIAFLAVAGVLIIVQISSLFHILTPIRNLHDDLKAESKLLAIILPDSNGLNEVEVAKEWFSKIAKEWEIEKKSAIERSEGIAKYQLATQVSHDIRSPLAALEMLLPSIQEVSEEKRVIIRNAINRIRDIANSLLIKESNLDISAMLIHEDISTEITYLFPVIDSIVTEKRIQFRGKLNVYIEFNYSNDCYNLFGKINSNELKRVISNIINNSVEAIGASEGKINIGLSKKDSTILISVHDNGIGMSKEILTRVINDGGSFGKNNGFGLGLSHAKDTVQRLEGSLHIESTKGIKQGTTVTISLPLQGHPNWFVSSINLIPKTKVVVFDDDSTIHQLWKERFSRADLVNSKIELVHINKPQQLRSYYGENFMEMDSHLFLMDYEILGAKENGIDLIEEFGVSKNSILVSSRFSEPQILARCIRLNIPLIPKTMTAFVPITV